MLLSGSIIQRGIRRASLLLFAFGALSAIGGEARDVAGTMPEDHFPALKTILQAAVKQSPAILLRKIEIEQQEAGIYGADARRLPNVGGDLRYDSSRTAISSNTSTQSRDNGLFYSFSIEQALYHWGAIKANSMIARIRVAIAERNYADAYRGLAVALRQAYVALVARKAGLRYERFNLGLAEANLKSALEKRDRGQISAGEFEGLKLNFEEARLSVDRLEAEFTGERRRFARLAGMSDLAEDALPGDIPPVVHSAPLTAALLAGLLRDGGKNLFTTQMAEMHVQEADLNYKIARVRLLPKFNASAGYSLLNSTNATPNSVSQTGVAQQTIEVNARWTVFDGFATKGAKLEALAEKRYWQRQAQLATETGLEEAQKLERTLGLDARAIEFAEIRRAGAAEGIRRANEEFKLGNAPQATIDGATRELRRTEYNRALAQAAFLSDWSAFVSLATDDPILNNLPSRYVREK